MNTNKMIPATQNEGYGFFGTMREDAQAAWPVAMVAISDATHQPLEAVASFLDSSYGRHFADEVLDVMDEKTDLAAAVSRVAARWLDRRHQSSVPYLTWVVARCGVSAR